MLLIVLGVSLVFGQGFDFGQGGMPGMPGMPGGGGAPGGAPGGDTRARDRSDDAMDAMLGLIPMRFFNAMNRNPIANAQIEIPNAGTFTTNNQGKITFPVIPDGNYTLVFSREGFITTPIEFRVQLGQVIFNWFSVSPGFSARAPLPPPAARPAALPPPVNNADRDFRIILEWGERPADLDLHFVKTGGSGGYHISYFNMRTADDGYATLDRDEMRGYGPETITIGRIEMSAVYTCYVHDYSNRTNQSSTQMAQNGATIRIYSLNQLLTTIRIPPNAAGTRWNAFRIERGEVIPVNTVSPQ